MLYVVKSFKEDKDTSGKGNPPLSEEGVQYGKKLKLRNNAINFDMCYTSYLLKDFSSALILVGDKIIVERSHILEDEKKDEIISLIKSLPLDKSILIVASDSVISIIKDNFDCMELK